MGAVGIQMAFDAGKEKERRMFRGGKAHFHSQGATALRDLVEEEELSQVTSRLELCWVILEQRK